MGVVIVDATVHNVTGRLELGTIATLAAIFETNFVAAHPDGTVRPLMININLISYSWKLVLLKMSCVGVTQLITVLHLR